MKNVLTVKSIDEFILLFVFFAFLIYFCISTVSLSYLLVENYSFNNLFGEISIYLFQFVLWFFSACAQGKSSFF